MFIINSITKEEVKEMISAAEEFNSKILDFVEKLSSEKIASSGKE